ncbi:MAG: hypothetical protein NTW78_04020 [Campylobacterales bacterium]|nr:hypothetical protein [Campylobacterales bacterium]
MTELSFMTNSHSTKHSREFIINTMYMDFGEKIDDEVIEASLIKLGIISAISYVWLKEHFIEKQLSAKECAELLGCSVGHVQATVQKFKLSKKKFGITTGNNEAQRRKLWKQKIQNAQPNRKEVVVFHEHSETPIFECPSITAAAKKLKLSREHVRDCLNPNRQRKTAGGFKFMFQKPWEEQKAFNKAKELEKIPKITAHTSYEEMIAIAKEDIKRNYR